MKVRRGMFQIVVGLSGILTAQVAGAATFVVDPLDPTQGFDDRIDADLADNVCATVAPVSCTLRAAVMQANATPGPDTITFREVGTTPQTYYVRLPTPAPAPGAPSSPWTTEITPCAATGDLDITESLTITGNVATPTNIIIDAGGKDGTVQDRIFQVTSGSPTCQGSGAMTTPAKVTIEGLTLKGGWQPKDNGGGGAIRVDGTVFGPATGSSTVSLLVKNTVFQSNFSFVTGGALAVNGGEVIVEDSTFDNSRTPYFPNIGLSSGGQGGFPGGAFIGGGQGGAVAVWAGNTTLRRCVIKGSYAQTGGAIYAQDASGVATKVLVEDSIIQGSYAFLGAGIFSIARGDWNFGNNTLTSHGVVLNRVTMETNIAEFAGGAIWQAGTLLISNSTLSNNRAWDDPGNPIYNNKGGGVYNSGRVLDIRSSTIAGNEAEEARVLDKTVANDAAGGDEIFFDNNNAASDASSQPFSFTIQNSIIGDGPSTIAGDPGATIDDNCNGPLGYRELITSAGGNLDSGGTCFAAAPVASLRVLAASDKTNVGNVFADALADNGALAVLPAGEVIKSRALATTSPAINAGTGCPGSDGRGYDRNGGCDAGAFQTNALTVAGNAAPSPQPDEVSVPVNGSVDIPVLLNDSDADATDKLIITEPATTTPTTLGTLSLVAATSNSPQFLRYTAGATPGADTVTYTVSDGKSTGTAQITINVRAAADNTAPVAVADSFLVMKEENTGLPVLKNDTDSNPGDSLTIVPASITVSPAVTTNGPSASVALGGKAINFVAGQVAGSYTLSYMIQDNFSARSESVTVTVVVNAEPTVEGQAVTLAPGALVDRILTSNDDEALTFALAIQPSQGCAVVNNTTGAFQYTALSEATGTDSFMIQAVDPLGAVASAVVSVNIEGTPVVPAAPCTVTRATSGETNNGGDGSPPPGGGGISSGGGSSSGGGVSNPPATNDTIVTDEGGGAIDMLWLSMFAALPWLRRRRASI